MNRALNFEFYYQLIALIAAFIVVHTVYVTLIRPTAYDLLQQQAEQQAQHEATGKSYVTEQSVYLIVKDYEQETCFILLLWAGAIMGFKTRLALRERGLLERSMVPVSEGISILPEDSREYARPVQALGEDYREMLLPRAVLAALQRFGSTRNIQDASDAVKNVCEAESERLDSELAMVRYIAWAIPSIGFIGTVRGIGGALSQASEAVAGNITGVTENLGVAFNSTLVALLLSIVLMFFMHQLQLIQERLVLNVQGYCDLNLIRHMQNRRAMTE